MSSNNTTNYRFPFIAVTSLFFMWGFITVMVDALIPRLKEVFELQYWQAALVQFAWFTAYLLISIPGGILISRIGYKRGIMSGLALIALGCLLFYPAASLRVYGLFLLALFVVASGITIIQVAANPYISVLGSPEGASSRLNLAQAFNSLGTTIAPLLAAAFLLSDKIYTEAERSLMSPGELEIYFNSEASYVQQTFLGVAGFTLLLMVVLGMVKLPKIINEQGDHSLGSFVKALKSSSLLFGAIGIFLYVGAEVAIGSWLTNYFMSMELAPQILASESLSSIVGFISKTLRNTDPSSLDEKGVVASFIFFYWGGAMVGRFIGSYLTSIFRPGAVLSAFAVGSVALIVASVSLNGFAAMWAILGVGLFNSIMFPTIFTMAISDLGDLKPQGSGILCTAISGGAVIPLLVGVTVDMSGFVLAFLLLTSCYLYIAWYGSKKFPAPNFE